MAYTQNLYMPSEVMTGHNNSLTYYPALAGSRVLPGEATYSNYGLNGATGSAYNYHEQTMPQQYVRPVLIEPTYVQDPQYARSFIQSTPPRRRSSNSHPYPLSIHDTTRSPTRSRFNVSHSNAAGSYETSQSSRSTRSRGDSAVVGPERHNRTHGKPPQDENISCHIRLNAKTPSSSFGPTNHVMVPQGIFYEPASSRSHHYRYPPITFTMKEFPEVGIKVASYLTSKPPVLDGDDDLIFKEVVERELKVQIIWPGYSKPFEKRLKTLRGTVPRGVLAVKLANAILDFGCHIRQTKAQIAHGQEQWAISDETAGLVINASEVFVTKLVHCGGCHWQMELWVPKDMY